MSASRRACQDAVSEWSHMGRYPAPEDIVGKRQLIDAVQRWAGCKSCGGTGWISRDVVKADGRYPYSSPCSCRPAPDWGALGERGTGELQKVAIEVGDE
jgi:hypothetical protein